MGNGWDWDILRRAAPDGGGTVLDTLIVGLRWTLAVTGAAWSVALLVGALVGAFCLSRNAGPAILGRAYAGLFRNVPLVIQLLGWFVVLPAVLPPSAASWLKQFPHAAFCTAALCLGLNGAARIAGRVRDAVRSVSPGQEAAAMALGMRPAQTTRSVVAPQAIRTLLPGLVAEAASLFGETTLILVVSTLGLLGATSVMAGTTGHPAELYLFVAALYFAISLAASWLVVVLQRRVAFARPGRLGDQR